MLSNTENTIDIEEIEDDKALLCFIVDYLFKRGFEKTITSLYAETPKNEILPESEIQKLINSVNEIRKKEQSGLFEWWRVFWNILKESKRDNKEIDNGVNVGVGVGIGANIKIGCNLDLDNSNLDSKESEQSAPKKIRKKSTNFPDTLDMTSLSGIENSLTTSGLMNKDLNKLTQIEAKRIEIALRSNKVSREAWELYLKLCKEYQRIPQSIGYQIGSNNNNKNNVYGSLSSSSSSSSSSSISISQASSHSNSQSTPKSISLQSFQNSSCNNYMGVIDQASQPIDSKQLLIFRQSLYQEYLKKQQTAISMITKSSLNYNSTSNPVIPSSSSPSSSSLIPNHSNHPNHPNHPNHYTTTNPVSPPEMINGNFYETSSEKEEIFYEFINEYLI